MREMKNTPGWAAADWGGRLGRQPVTLRGLPFVAATLVEDPRAAWSASGALPSFPRLPPCCHALTCSLGTPQPGRPPSSALAAWPQETPACLSLSISSPAAPGSRCAVSTGTCSLARELIPRIQPLLTGRAREGRVLPKDLTAQFLPLTSDQRGV